VKRSPMPPRKAPLRRRAELNATASRHPASTLAPVSKKRLAENRVRKGWGIDRCALEGFGLCRGPLDLHEIVRRAAAPGGRTDPRLVIGLCRAHHGEDLYANRAAAIGIRIPSSEWIACDGNADDEQRLIDRAARRRAETIVNGEPK